MARGKPHDPLLRAQAVAAIIAGGTIDETARRFAISPNTLKGWWAEDRPVQPSHARTREEMAELIYDCTADLLRAIRLQLQAVGDQAWAKEQSAADLASLLDREIDGALRLLAGFRPAGPADGADGDGRDPDRHVLDAPAGPADEGV